MNNFFHIYSFILLFLNGGVTIGSRYLDNARTDFSAYESSGTYTVQDVQYLFSKKNSEILEAYKYIDYVFPDIDKRIVRNDDCNVTKKYYKEDMKAAFKMDLELYSLDLTEEIIELKNKVYEVEKLINLYSNLAANKNRICKLLSRNCTSETENWVEGKVRALLCGTVAECPAHNVIKRSSTSSCSGFRCKNGECISANDVCTGKYTCIDGSDEMPNCTDNCINGFHCINKVCIDKNKVCDHRDDCGDNSDEEGCAFGTESACTVEYGRYECANKNCISLEKVCDTVDDCLDNSDEGSGCTENSCTNGRCTSAGGVCLQLPEEAVCLSHCPPNMFESDTGCLRQRTGRTIAQILDHIPFSVQRFMAKMKHRRMLLYKEINEVADRLRFCQHRASFTNLHVTNNGTNAP